MDTSTANRSLFKSAIGTEEQTTLMQISNIILTYFILYLAYM